jgi:2-hydroxyglutarate dehydrogenase
MNFLANKIMQLRGDMAFRTRVVAIETHGDASGGYVIRTEGNGDCIFLAKSVVNSAGLYADKVAQMAMGSQFPPEYKIYYVKGHYFAYSGRSLVSRLIYPVPEKNIRSLGIHATIDLAGKLKFGPDVKYQSAPDDYSVDESLRDTFYENIRRYLPAVEKNRLYPDYAGIRPKLSGPDEPFRDFVIQEESARGFPNLINLVGIESPGLTSSLAIAELVAKLLGYTERDTVP